jgi:predicted peroxiredoxin
MSEKLVFMVTHGPKDAELASIPFVMAVAGLAMDSEAVVVLQADGVELAVKGVAETVITDCFPPLSELLGHFTALGGQLLLCGPSVSTRHINAETQLIEGSEVVAAARLVIEIGSATNVLTY